MPTFIFEAINEAGKPHKGSIAAANNEEAIQKIRSQGFFPTSVKEQKGKKSGGEPAAAATGEGKKKSSEINLAIPGFDGVSNKDLALFTRQLSTLQDAGLPLLRSLAVLEQQQKPGTLKRILQKMQEDVSGGSSLSDAMMKHPKGFDRLYVKMVAAGEVGGVLDVILQRLAEFLEKSEKLKGKIKSAMVYPSVVLSVAFFIVMGIMIGIVPKFIDIFKSFGAKMPAPTQFLLWASKWLAGPMMGMVAGKADPEAPKIPGLIWVLGAPIVIIFAFIYIRKTKMGKHVIDRVILVTPVLGPLAAKSTIARFTRTLGTLVTAGVPILDAIRVTSETTSNGVFAKALDDAHDSVRQGDTFAEPLRKAKVCDPIVTNMIEVGEETGDLDKMLIKIADNYDDEVDNAVAALVSVIEPMMVVVLGGVVGGIVISLFLPMITIMESLMGGK